LVVPQSAVRIGIHANENQETCIATKVSRSRQTAAQQGDAQSTPVAVKGTASNAKAREAPGSKQAVLLALMRRRGGTTIDEAVTALGWRPHSIRALISGVARKKLGLSVQTDRDDKGRLQYRIG
jgi:hypothetical protein